MQKYIGVKLINAKPMTRAEYNAFRGWQLPSDENPEDAGFLVEYVDGGKSNTDLYAGYVSWSPAEVFNNAYKPIEGMTFGLAIEALKRGQLVARAGWNGKGMWLKHIPAGGNLDFGTGQSLPILPWIGMKTADNKFVPWLASQTDVLAEDWNIL